MKRPMRLLALALAVVWLAGCVTTGDSDVVDPSEVSLKEAAKYNTQLGVAYMRQGKYDLAMQKLKRALQQDSDSAEAHMAMAVLDEQLDRTDDATDHWEAALDLAPDNPTVHNNYGAFLCQHDRLRDAEKQFLAAANNRLYKTPAAAYTNAGICVKRIPDLESAEKYFRKALEIDPKFPDALWQMASLSYEQKQYFQARAFMQRYMDVASPSPESLALAVRIERGAGNQAAAGRYLRELQQKFPDAEQTQALTGTTSHGG